MLQIEDLTFRYGGRVLFDRAGATVPKGHRVAVIGRNGTGKTTLLRLISGDLVPDGGSIALPRTWRVGRLNQQAPGGATSLLETVLAFDTERSRLLHAGETETDPHRIAEIQTRLADIGAQAAPARAASILSGLGFSTDAQQKPCSAFSGGWRMRVALAGVLFSEPDLLLLDEPTNHLDLEATLWFEQYLKSYRHTVVIVSHDRSLLDKVPSAVLHVEAGQLRFYTGGYSQFERQRREQRLRQMQQREQQEEVRKRLQTFVDRFRAKATKARQAQSRLKRLEKLEPIAAPVIEEKTIRFDFPQPDPLAPPILTLTDAAVGYDGTPVLRNLNLRVDMDDRIAVLGANGNGKSTLIKLLARRLPALSGDLKHPNRLRVGYFAQDQAEALDLAITPVAQLRRFMPDATDTQVRNHLGRFGFGADKADTIIADLSGGEKARLVFALMSRERPHILMLDEPTNHLDIDSRASLVEAINGFEGAVLLITHDASLIELCADRLWLVRQGTCRAFDGDLDDYWKMLREDSRSQRRAGGSQDTDGPAQTAPRPEAGASTNKKEQRRAAADLRAALAPLRRKATDAEKQVAKLTERKRALEQTLANPNLYEGPVDAVTRTQIDLDQTCRNLEAAEATWLEAMEALEDATAAEQV